MMTTIVRDSQTKVSVSGGPISPKSQMEQEKRIRREIANSNERRRMQSINAGFQSLRNLLPHHDGEKLSKAAILQHTADYIYQLEQEKTRLLAQNCQLKRLVNSQIGHESDVSNDNSPLHKKIKLEKSALTNGTESSDSSDEGVAMCRSPKMTNTNMAEIEPNSDELKREMVELRLQLDRERRLRVSLEDQTRALESQLYPDKIREITQNVAMQFHTNKLSDASNSESVDTLIASDEVIAETIEVETHSSPGSPQPSAMSPNAVLFRTSAPTLKSNALNGVLTLSDAPQDLSAKTTSGSPKKNSIKTIAQPAAIALPIDVPFIANDSVGQLPTTVTLELIRESGSTTCSAGSTSRQNLDTIVEAIRHLEGDHLFRDDDNGNAVVVKQLVPSNDIDDNVSVSPASLSPALRTVLTMSPEQFGAIRHQVIQLQRPNVIVANHA